MTNFFKVQIFAFAWMSTALAGTGAGGGLSSLGFTCLNGSSTDKPYNGCKAALPQCSEIVSGKPGAAGVPAITGIVEEVKSMLSYQIWGYYNKMNLDLNHSRLEVNSKAGWVGEPFPHTICSPVGDKLQVTGGAARAPDIEFTKQNIGAKESCGTFLAFHREDKAGMEADFDLLFNKDSGGVVAAHNYSALIWTIRKNAADVLDKINERSISDLSEVLKDVVNGPDGRAVMDQLKALSENENLLSAKEKENCNKDLDIKNVCEKLDVTDPAQRVCSIKKARIMISRGALPALIVRQIMIGAERDFKNFFKLNTDSNKALSELFLKCHGVGGQLGSQPSKRACAASCVAGITDELTNGGNGQNWYCVNGPNLGSRVKKGDCNSKALPSIQRACWVNSRASISNESQFNIQKQYRDIMNNIDGSGVTSFADPSYSVLSGVSGTIEASIRRYCGQKKITDPSPCDKIGIPALPKGWNP